MVECGWLMLVNMLVGCFNWMWSIHLCSLKYQDRSHPTNQSTPPWLVCVGLYRSNNIKQSYLEWLQGIWKIRLKNSFLENTMMVGCNYPKDYIFFIPSRFRTPNETSTNSGPGLAFTPQTCRKVCRFLGESCWTTFWIGSTLGNWPTIRKLSKYYGNY